MTNIRAEVDTRELQVWSLLHTAEAAQALGISGRTLSRYGADDKLLPAVVLCGAQRTRYRWDLDDLRRQFRELAREKREQ